MSLDLLRVAAGTVLVSLPGFSALRAAPWAGSPTRAARWALAFAVGLALAVPVCFAAGLFGVPLRGRVIAAICFLLAVAIRLSTARSPARPARAVFPLSAAAVASRVLLAASAALFLAKVAAVPVWSWDYFTVHGTKARRVFAEKTLDLAALAPRSLMLSVPDYPLGMPVGWRLLALGAPPDERSVKLFQAVFALALLALVREGILAAGRSEPVANTAAAFAAISPLLWDTESLGLMEVPLALFLAASFLLLLELPRDDSRRGGEWIWGAAAGFLPWIKIREGLALALFLSIAMLLSRKVTRKFRALAAVAAGCASSACISIFLLPKGVAFLAGNWLFRGLARAAHPGAIVLQLAKDLVAPEWLGFWILFAAGWVYSIVRKRRAAAILGSVIAAQIAVYASVYFFTYLDPVDHIRSSFFRIVAALLPAALIALAAGGDLSGGVRGDSSRRSEAQNTLRMSL